MTPDKPIFKESKKEDKVFTVEEGKSLMIKLEATANPGPVEYKWKRKGGVGIPALADALPQSRLIAMGGGSLNVSQARREDAGDYTVKASNSEGKSTFKFKLDVQYAPR